MASDQVLNNTVQSIINVTGGTEITTTLAPKQNGEFRIPFVKNLRIGPISNYFGGSQFTLLWDEPDTTESISHYNVFTVGELQNNKAPLGPYSAVTSPAIFRITPSTTGIITFFVQTQLQNGNVSDISSSPSVTAVATPPRLNNGDLSGGIIFPTFGIVRQSAASDYIFNSWDSTAPPDSIPVCIEIEASGGARVVYLPLIPYEGQVIIVKKIENSANTVTVVPIGPATIEGGINYIIAGGSRGAVTIMYNTPFNDWRALAKF